MALKTLLHIFILVNVLRAFKTLPIESDEDDACSADEVASIVNEHTYLLEERSNATTAKAQQLIDSISKITESREYRQLKKIVDQNKKSLEILKEGLCTNESIADYEFKLEKVDATLVKCSAGANKTQTSLKSSANSIITKLTSSKTKASAALQKCSGQKVATDCAAVTACCDQALLKSSGKVDMLFNKTATKLAKAETSQNGCLKKAVKQMLDIEAGIKQELLECSLQESNESGEHGEPKTTIKSTDAPTTKVTEPPVHETQPPLQETQPPPQVTQPPPQETQPPPQDTQPPSQETQPPPQETQAPPQDTQSPPQETEPPPQEPQRPQQPQTTTHEEHTDQIPLVTEAPENVVNEEAALEFPADQIQHIYRDIQQSDQQARESPIGCIFGNYK